MQNIIQDKKVNFKELIGYASPAGTHITYVGADGVVVERHITGNEYSREEAMGLLGFPREKGKEEVKTSLTREEAKAILGTKEDAAAAVREGRVRTFL